MSYLVFVSLYWGWRTLSNTCPGSCLFIIPRPNGALCNTYLNYRISILRGRALIYASAWRILSKISKRTSSHTSSIYCLFPWSPWRIPIWIIRSYRANIDTCSCLRVSKIIRSWRTCYNALVCRIIRKIRNWTFSYTSICCLISKSWPSLAWIYANSCNWIRSK